MRFRESRLLWTVSALIALCVLSGAAQGQTRYDELLQNPTDGDPCPEMTVEECFYSDAGYANGGTAGGMAACTAYKYCTSCEFNLFGSGSTCIRSYRNDYCQCAPKTLRNGVQSCSANGACTYKGT